MKFQTGYLPYYILVTSLFFGNFIIQYISLLIFSGFYLIYKPKVRLNLLTYLPLLLVIVAFLSFSYNYFTGNADGYTIIFWLASYLPPFILCGMISRFHSKIEFHSIYNFYKKLVYAQTFFLIYSALSAKKFIVGDAATGTIGDANWVAFHICVVLIYEIVRTIDLSKRKMLRSKSVIKSISEIFYFLVVLMIPESTANLGFLILVITALVANEFILVYEKPLNFLFITLLCVAGAALVVNTVVFERIKGAMNDLAKKEIESDPYLFKLSMYKNILTGRIYKDTNIFLGSGPSTFTSRSSVVRMPEERVNTISINLPYFKSDLFDKYISSQYAQWRINRESYGNFASPQTTIISVAVELGLVGLVTFLLFFKFIYSSLARNHSASKEMYLFKFGRYLTLFFLMSLFHLNFWEYPIISFTYIIFVSLLLNGRKNIA